MAPHRAGSTVGMPQPIPLGMESSSSLQPSLPPPRPHKAQCSPEELRAAPWCRELPLLPAAHTCQSDLAQHTGAGWGPGAPAPS